MGSVLAVALVVVLCSGGLTALIVERASTVEQIVEILNRPNENQTEVTILLSPNTYYIDAFQHAPAVRFLSFIGDSRDSVIFKCTNREFAAFPYWFGTPHGPLYRLGTSNSFFVANVTIKSCGTIVSDRDSIDSYKTPKEFSNCAIIDNGGLGAMFRGGFALDLVIRDSILSDNYGEITINRCCSFTLISSVVQNHRSAIIGYSATINIYSSLFFSSTGDLIRVYEYSKLEISNSVFEENNAHLVHVEKSNARIQSTVFKNNKNNGPLFTMHDGFPSAGLVFTHIESCKFINNYGQDFGPVFYAISGELFQVVLTEMRDERVNISVKQIVGGAYEVGEVVVIHCTLNGLRVNYTQTPETYEALTYIANPPTTTISTTTSSTTTISTTTSTTASSTTASSTTASVSTTNNIISSISTVSNGTSISSISSASNETSPTIILAIVLCFVLGLGILAGILVQKQRTEQQIHIRSITKLAESMGLYKRTEKGNFQLIEEEEPDTEAPRQLRLLTNVTISEKKIGVGSNSEVYEGKIGDTRVAVKFSNAPNLPTNILEELQRKNSSPHILRVYGIMLNDQWKRGIVSEYVNFGTLTALFSKKEIDYSLKFAIDLAVQIAEGMATLAVKPSIIHGDLCPSTILLHCSYDGTSYEYTVKLNNIGRRFDPNDKINLLYSAPEVLHSGVFTTQADVWSFAVVVCEILGQGIISEWSSLSEKDLYTEIYSGNHPKLPTTFNYVTKTQSIPWALQQILAKCFAIAPELRPTFEQLVTELENIRNSIVLPDEIDIADNRPMPAILQYLAQQQT